MSKTERVALLPDLHVDDQDPKAVALAAQLVEAFKPHRVIWLGDILDSGWASPKYRRQLNIQGQFEREVAAWDVVRPLFKARHVQVLLGNHERRLIDFIDQNVALEGFRGLKIESYLTPEPHEELVKTGIIKLARGKFAAIHGDVVRKWAGYTAKAEMERYGISGASGHTHRLAAYYQRDHRGVRVWFECGHLAKNPPRYAACNEPGAANWQQGLTLLWVEGDRFHGEPIPFTLNYKATLHGKRYSA